MKQAYIGMLSAALLLAAVWDVCGLKKHGTVTTQIQWYLKSPERQPFSGPQVQRRPSGNLPELHWLNHAKHPVIPRLTKGNGEL